MASVMQLIKSLLLYAMVKIALKYVCEYDVIFTHHSSVVHQLKVSIVFAFFVWPRFQEVGRLAKVIVIEFSFEAALCGFREHALLLQNRQYTQRLQTKQEGCNS